MAKKRFKIIYVFCLLLTIPILWFWVNRDFISGLIKYAPPAGKSALTAEDLVRSVKMRDINELKFILNSDLVDVDAKTDSGVTALFVAVDIGRMDLIKILVEKHDANINIRSHDITALDIAMYAIKSIQNYEKDYQKTLVFYDEHGKPIYPKLIFRNIVRYLRERGARTGDELENNSKRKADGALYASA
jgi:hypothetical protein